MEFIWSSDVKTFLNPGVASRQLLSPENSSSTRVTITEVHLIPGAVQPRHIHPAAEQVWYALRGSGKLLLTAGGEALFSAGDLVRFAEGDVHGLRNDSAEEFVYLSVTSPPLNFRYAYQMSGF